MIPRRKPRPLPAAARQAWVREAVRLYGVTVEVATEVERRLHDARMLAGVGRRVEASRSAWGWMWERMPAEARRVAS